MFTTRPQAVSSWILQRLGFMDLMHNHSIKWFIFFVGLLASWLTFSPLLPFFIFVLIWLSAFVFLAVQKSYLRYFIILFSCWIFLPIATFVKTTRQYFQGDAVMSLSENKSPEFYNLDRKFRVWNEKTPPILWGDEVLVREANNFTIRFWVTLRGFQQGAYAGTYPAPFNANQTVETKGRVVPIEKTEAAIRIKFDDGFYHMTDVRHPEFEDLTNSSKAKVTIINNDLVIVKPISKLTPSVIYLADYKSGSIIARYLDAENSQDESIVESKDRRLKKKKRS
jgi:hypothetical protein